MGIPRVRDVDEREILEGAIVCVLGLASGLLDGLPDDEVAFLQSAVGTHGEVDEILDGDVSVMLKQSRSRYHFIRSPGHLLRVQDGETPAKPECS